MDWGMGLWEEDDGGAGVWAGRGVMWNRDPLGRFVLIFSFNTKLGTHMGHLRFVILFGR